MTRLDMSFDAISRRIKEASGASDLRADLRLQTKIDLSAEGVSRRLREVFELNDLCARIKATGPARD